MYAVEHSFEDWMSVVRWDGASRYITLDLPTGARSLEPSVYSIDNRDRLQQMQQYTGYALSHNAI